MSKISLVKVVQAKPQMTQKEVVKKSPENVDKKGVPQWFKDAVYEEPHSLDGWFYEIYDRVIINELIANGEIELAKEKFLTMVSSPIELRKQAVTRSTQLGKDDSWQYTNEFQTKHVEDASIFDITNCYNRLKRDKFARKIIEQLESRIDNIKDLESIITNKSLVQRLSYLAQQQELLGDKFPLDISLDTKKLILGSSKKSKTSINDYLNNDAELSSFLLSVDLSARNSELITQFESWLESTRERLELPEKIKITYWNKWHEEALLQISDLKCWEQLSGNVKYTHSDLVDIIWPMEEDEKAVERMKKTKLKNVRKYISIEGLEQLLYSNEFSKAV